MSRRRKPLRIEDDAAQELRAAIEWYESRLPGLGLRFLHAVETTLGHIEAFPRSGAPIPSVAHLPVRSFPVRKFPFHVVCLDTGDTLWVLAFAHDRRRPNYWRRRISVDFPKV